jgi:hypothetical protein
MDTGQSWGAAREKQYIERRPWPWQHTLLESVKASLYGQWGELGGYQREAIHREPALAMAAHFAFCEGLSVHCKKRLSFFPSPAGMSLAKLSLAGNNLIISVQGELG